MLLVVITLTIGQCLLLAVRGQTLGKMALGVRIVRRTDGSNPGFWRTVLVRNVVPSLIGLLPFFGPLFSLIDLLSIFGEERRCLHDYLAGTRVVEV